MTLRASLAVLALLGIAACSGAPAPSNTTIPTLAPTPTGGATTTTSPTSSPSISAAPTGGNLDAWRVGAVEFFDRIGERFEFECPPGGEANVVWGTDVYTADSSVCTAAVHAGMITLAQGGTVTIEMLTGQSAYEGSTRNGVETRSYPSYGGSFRVVGADEPSPTPSGSPTGGLTELFSDDFSDPASGFAVGQTDSGTAAYSAGSFEIEIPPAQASIWTRRLFNAGPFPMIQANGRMVALGAGMGGFLCGGGGASVNHFVGMIIATDGRWFAVEVMAGSPTTVLEQGTVADESVFLAFRAQHVSVSCAQSDSGLAMSLALGDPAVPVADYSGSAGPASFDKVALYAEALADDFVMLFDDLTVRAGEIGGGLVDQLLGHIPAEYLPECQPTPPSAAEAGALVAVACFLQESGNPGAEIIEYVQFDSKASMDAAYQQRASAAGAVPTDGDCSEGPDEDGYNIGGQLAGRAFCAAQPFGIRLDWTDDRLNILTSATDFDSSYADLHGTWLQAGPDL